MSVDPAKFSDDDEPEIKSCGVIVFRENPELQFLLMEHTDRLDLPKGHMDEGESELETALRELVEETGIKSKDIQLDDNFRYSQKYIVNQKRYGAGPRLKELVIFLGDLINEVEIELTEHKGYRWVDWDPPHKIQKKTINPLLKELADYWQ